MKYFKVVAGSVLTAGLLLSASVSAEEVRTAEEISAQQYQIAIEKFGVSAEVAKVAAQQAAAENANDTQPDANDDFLAKLPADFLDGSSF